MAFGGTKSFDVIIEARRGRRIFLPSNDRRLADAEVPRRRAGSAQAFYRFPHERCFDMMDKARAIAVGMPENDVFELMQVITLFQWLPSGLVLNETWFRRALNASGRCRLSMPPLVSPFAGAFSARLFGAVGTALACR